MASGNVKKDRPRKPRAELESHVSIPDGSVCLTGIQLKKVWKVKNTGKKPWMEGCSLVFQRGELKPISILTKIPALPPGSSCKVSVMIQVPIVRGKYESYFRLRTPEQNGRRVQFGDSLHIKLDVREEEDRSEEDESSDEDSSEDSQEKEEKEESEEEEEPDEDDDEDSMSDLDIMDDSEPIPQSVGRRQATQTPETTSVSQTSSETGERSQLDESNEEKVAPMPEVPPGSPIKWSRDRSGSMANDDITLQDIKWGIRIGSGAYGDVYRGFLWGQDVALKKLRMKGIKASDMNDFKQEIKIMRTLRHPNIVNFLGACYEQPRACMITEFLHGGTLEEWMEAQHDKGILMSTRKVLSYALQIARGLNWLHHKGIIHRDLKTANILMDKNGNLKITDFGLSHMKTRKEATTTGWYGCVGTPCYMAPEVLNKDQYGLKSDVFSFGVILDELVVGEYPYEGVSKADGSTNSFEHAIITGLRPPIPEDCFPPLAELIRHCWEELPENRPTFDEVVDRLMEIEEEFLAEEHDIVAELPPDVQHLFEEKERRERELVDQIEQLKKKLKTAKNALSRERAEKEEREDHTRHLTQKVSKWRQLTDELRAENRHLKQRERERGQGRGSSNDRDYKHSSNAGVSDSVPMSIPLPATAYQRQPGNKTAKTAGADAAGGSAARRSSGNNKKWVPKQGGGVCGSGDSKRQQNTAQESQSKSSRRRRRRKAKAKQGEETRMNSAQLKNERRRRNNDDQETGESRGPPPRNPGTPRPHFAKPYDTRGVPKKGTPMHRPRETKTGGGKNRK